MLPYTIVEVIIVEINGIKWAITCGEDATSNPQAMWGCEFEGV